MADYTFTTPEGQSIKREMLLAYLNTGTEEEPEWSVVGKRITDSSMEFDWGEESKTDILGDTYTTLSKPTITQTFDPCLLEKGNKALEKLWVTAIVEQDYAALSAMDMLIVHAYAGFGERYKACMIKPSSLGGAGGGNIGMPFDVTYGGVRVKGSATVDNNKSVTFAEEI